MSSRIQLDLTRQALQARADSAASVLAGAIARGPDLVVIRACHAEVLRAKAAVADFEHGPSNAVELPTEIQWMPPGEHRISATSNGKTVERTVRVDAAAADRMQILLQELRAKAAAGAGDTPFLDFDNRDGPAAATVLAFRWGGSDPVTGGIRALVEWTKPGRDALLGGAYRRLSPTFFADSEGRITGAPVNMGGLVNRAAFKTIQPIVN